MTRGYEKDKLKLAWNSVSKDWYSIYQWGRTSGAAYTEWIAEWIVESFDLIRLETAGLRMNRFKTEDHKGQAQLQTDISQFTEKRFVRAVFNLGEISPLGKIIDYEVPLKATGSAEHGDIDLLCLASGDLLCVEAKNPQKSESVLKAILQAVVYTWLASVHIDKFIDEFKLPMPTRLTPAILIFRDSASGRQLGHWGNHPHLAALLQKLDTKLANIAAGRTRFFIIENAVSETDSCLRLGEVVGGGEKVIFSSGFDLKIVEWANPGSRLQTAPLNPSVLAELK